MRYNIKELFLINRKKKLKKIHMKAEELELHKTTGKSLVFAQ